MKTLKILGLSIFSSLLFTGTSFAQSDVSDQDLERFVAIYKDVQKENQELQEKFLKILEDEGMDVQRFQEIQLIKANPETKSTLPKEELEKHDELMEKVNDTQLKFQEKIPEIIKEGGMTIEKYQEIFVELQANEALQQKFVELMQG
jgi:hypothetical protein